MYADHTMLELLGFSTEPAPEGVTASGMTVLTPTITILYSLPWNESLPMAAPRYSIPGTIQNGRDFIRCGGKRDFSYTGGRLSEGYHQNITNTFMLKKNMISLSRLWAKVIPEFSFAIWMTRSYKAIKVSGRLQELSLKYTKFGDFFRVYSAEGWPFPTAPPARFSGYEAYFKRLSDGESRSKSSSETYSADGDVSSSCRLTDIPPNTFVIAAFDEQDDSSRHRCGKMCFRHCANVTIPSTSLIWTTIWRSLSGRKSLSGKAGNFPKAVSVLTMINLSRDYVFSGQREKMRRAGSPDFLRNTLSARHPVYDIDFRRIYPEGLIWVRSRFSIAEIKDGRVSKVILPICRYMNKR